MSNPWKPALILTGIYSGSFIMMMVAGFGGGHGALDLPIGILAMPWIFLLSLLPESFLTNDLVHLIIFPYVMNMIVVYSIRAIIILWSDPEESY
ncbi:hypothetical protein [Terriglobus albidus]|uniref:hypothetical protein n=1 Tax=Terriglobus albidus TaxID=1592106 RepID=UPI0021E0AE12|nr:hypothetical protein [Terriglobus albidus]